MSEVEWFARNMAEWPDDTISVYRDDEGRIMRVIDPKLDPLVQIGKVAVYEGEWQRERDRLFSGRIDLTGQNGNTGEHYEPAATVRDMADPVIYTTVRELRITHDGGYIDVTALADGSVDVADHVGGEFSVPSLAVLDAIRDAMARIVGE